MIEVAHPLHKAEAVESGHAQVQDCETIDSLRHMAQRFLARLGHVNLAVWELEQQGLTDEHDQMPLIIHYQDTRLHRILLERFYHATLVRTSTMWRFVLY